MALAWNAGWVNTPRGFKSRIIRRRMWGAPVAVAPRTQRSMSACRRRLRRGMGRTFAVVWHALFSVVAGVLYFFFVLPRWWELSGETSHTLGTVMRIVAGALIALAALPVVLTLLRTRRPEYGTPQLALRLRVCSIVLHVLGGALIIGAAVSEIWFSLDDAGRWLFGRYGAAAAVEEEEGAQARVASQGRRRSRRRGPGRRRGGRRGRRRGRGRGRRGRG